MDKTESYDDFQASKDRNAREEKVRCLLLRDEFALGAMQSYLAKTEYAGDPEAQRQIALSAYKMADTMPEARKFK